ncbi:MAG: hypothetical protein LBF84_03080 [Holosporales bacterium]|jgi:hypothetical protein|nr:hypothetical protein [Holosporales bacterium]
MKFFSTTMWSMALKKSLDSARSSGAIKFNKIADNALRNPMTPQFCPIGDQKSPHQQVVLLLDKIRCKPYDVGVSRVFTQKWFADVRAGKSAVQDIHSNQRQLLENQGVQGRFVHQVAVSSNALARIPLQSTATRDLSPPGRRFADVFGIRSNLQKKYASIGHRFCFNNNTTEVIWTKGSLQFIKAKMETLTLMFVWIMTQFGLLKPKWLNFLSRV